MEKIHRIKIVIAITLACSIFSCTNHFKIREEFEHKYPLFKLDSLPLLERTKFETFVNYNLTSLDSNKLLSFTFIRKDFNEMKQGSVHFDLYLEKTIKNGFFYVSAFNENKKLLYSFKQTENRYTPGKEAVFLKGKYYYYYKFYYAQLNAYQRLFYEKNKDSIVNNLTNDIPQFEEVFNMKDSR